MTHPVPVHLQDDLFFALCKATGEGWFGDKTSEALSQAVRNYLAEGHAIISDGKPVTPSQLANQQGGVRNAWRVLWLRLPDEDWERADRCRD